MKPPPLVEEDPKPPNPLPEEGAVPKALDCVDDGELNVNPPELAPNPVLDWNAFTSDAERLKGVSLVCCVEGVTSDPVRLRGGVFGVKLNPPDIGDPAAPPKPICCC